MAAKKKSKSTPATKKKTSTVAANKATKGSAKKPAGRRKAAKAATARSVARRKAATSGTRTTKKASTKPSRSKAKSVDGILKSFDRERVSKQTQQVLLQKQIKDLSAKIKASEKQLAKLQKKHIDTQHAIATLDARRDAEIGKLLSTMGVNLDSAALAAESAKKKKVDKPTPLFDKPVNGSTGNSTNGSAKKPGEKSSAVTDDGPKTSPPSSKPTES